MKAIKYIAAIALFAGLVSCQQEMKQDIQTLLPEADAVEVTFNVQFPEPIPVGTKASTMGEGPVLDGFSLYFCLYGAGDGYVQNWIPAELSNEIISNGYLTGGKFKILLPLTDEKRIVHVIANPPAEANPITSDYIYNVMEKLVTKKDTVSYWQEIVLNNGIRATENASGKLIPAQDLQDALEDIHLVRNFAKVNVIAEDDPNSEETGTFSIGRWTLINVPDMAYVAPYDGSITDVTFPEGYTKIATFADGKAIFDQLTDVDKYPGYFPPETQIDETYPGDPEGTTASKYATGTTPLYMYERPIPDGTHKQSAVLVEVIFSDEHPIVIAYNALHTDAPVESLTYWYKVEMLDEDGYYMPFLRDMAYILKISGIASEGELTPRAAFDGPYFGNISASLETASLNQLSDGKSTVHVDLMDYTFVSETGTKTLMNGEEASLFWFVPDDSNPEYKFASEDGVCDIKVELLDVNGYEPALTAVVANPNSTPDGSMQVTLAATGTKIKKSIIRVSGRKGDDEPTNVNKYIYREITVNLMPTQTFALDEDHVTEIVGTPTVLGAGNEVEIQLYLPKDLGASVFPIQVRIEAENNSLSATTPDLPVSTGKSKFDANRNTYFFIRTIEYSEYCKLDPVTKKYVYDYDYSIKFKTSKPGDNSTKINISDMAGRFNDKELTLGTVTP